MTKFIMSVLFASILFASSPVLGETNNVSANAGGALGYAINTLRYNGQLKTLDDYAFGLGLSVGMNEKLNSEGEVIKPATWGWEFTTDRLSDQDLKITRVSPKAWIDASKITLLAGATWGRIVPGEVGGTEFIGDETRLIGGNLGIRFEAKGFPWEFGGSWVWRYSGDNDVNLSDLHLALVPSF